MPPKKQNKPKRAYRKKPAAKRRAYKPANKKAQIAKMLPIAEGRKVQRKSLVAQYLAENADTNHWRVIIPHAWLYMFREQYLETFPTAPTGQGFTGRTLYSRFINLQLKINFEKIRFNPNIVDFRILHGWCKLPYLTSPEALGSDTQKNVNGVKIGYDIADMISEKLDKQFQDVFPKNDPKIFKLNYNRRIQVKGTDGGVMSVNQEAAGQPVKETIIPQLNRRDLEYRVSWRPQKKFHMIPVTTGNGLAADGSPISVDDGDIISPINPHKAHWTPSNTTNGELWVPFFAIRPNNTADFGKNPAGEADTSAYPALFHQSTHYFMDV